MPSIDERRCDLLCADPGQRSLPGEPLIPRQGPAQARRRPRYERLGPIAERLGRIASHVALGMHIPPGRQVGPISHPGRRRRLLTLWVSKPTRRRAGAASPVCQFAPTGGRPVDALETDAQRARSGSDAPGPYPGASTALATPYNTKWSLSHRRYSGPSSRWSGEQSTLHLRRV